MMLTFHHYNYAYNYAITISSNRLEEMIPVAWGLEVVELSLYPPSLESGVHYLVMDFVAHVGVIEQVGYPRPSHCS